MADNIEEHLANELEKTFSVPQTKTLAIGAHKTIEQQRNMLLNSLKETKAELERRLKQINDWIGQIDREF